jgi:hypothetical protein
MADCQTYSPRDFGLREISETISSSRIFGDTVRDMSGFDDWIGMNGRKICTKYMKKSA